MGTWELPNTKQKAEQLKEMFKKPIKANQKTRDKLCYIYGDDALFDEILDREFENGSNYDVRFLIASYIDSLLIYYKEQPECFYVKFQKGAIKTLENIIKNYDL